MDRYIGTKVIQAEPCEKDGQAGFAVIYEDGYTSWSPEEAFRKAYRKIAEGLTFSQALEALKVGKKARRDGWNGKGLTIGLQRPDSGSLNTLPYLYMTYPADAKVYPSARVPWLASQTDILAEDWELVE